MMYSPWEVAGIEGRVLLCHQFLVVQSVALSSAVPRQDGTAGRDKQRAGRARLRAQLSDLSKKSSRRSVVKFVGEGSNNKHASLH